jgi:hypothetical protein
MINFHFILIFLENPILRVKLSRIFKILYLYKMSNLTKWVTCKWNIDFSKLQVSGALKDTWVLANYAWYTHNMK